jgi:hypothetical protein
MSQVWVNGKLFTSENNKSGKWIPAAKQESKLYGKCVCGELIYEGDPVGMVADHVKVICYSCWLAGILADGHCDCAGLRLPDATLSQ